VLVQTDIILRTAKCSTVYLAEVAKRKNSRFVVLDQNGPGVYSLNRNHQYYIQVETNINENTTNIILC